jgi:predicted  nucleic acid-binding Zn-ribbon protein
LSSPVLTIVPLTSIKANTNVANLPSDNLLLGNEIYTLLSQKLKTYLKEIDEQREYIISEVTKISKKIDSINMNDSDGPETIREMREKIKSLEIAAEHLKNKKGQSEKVNGELSRMKIGSIALVGQITTISKIRIYNPLSTKDSLGRVRISDETLDKLDKKLVELFKNIPIENATSS